VVPSIGAVDGFAWTAAPEALGWTAASLGFTAGRWWWPVPPPVDADAPLDVIPRATAAGAWLVARPDLTLGRSAAVVDALGAPSRAAGAVGAIPPAVVVGDAGWVALFDDTDGPLTLDGPGGTEVVTGATAAPGPRTLAPGAAELWWPAR
ncbi:MAG: hypothetical protein ABMB14_12535, partial [Myxococcota bacterium]